MSVAYIELHTPLVCYQFLVLPHRLDIMVRGGRGLLVEMTGVTLYAIKEY